MRHAVIAVLSVSAAFAAFASAGDDAKTYDVEWRQRWKVGQIVTVTASEVGDTETKLGAKTVQSEHETLETTYVVRCDAVDAQDNPVKRTIHFKSWKQTKNAATDESISGAVVEVDGTKWTVTGGKTAGKLATKWLASELGEEDDDPFRRLTPPKMAVGQTWKPDGKTAGEAFSKSMENAPFDTAATEMEVTLVSVEGAPPDAVGKFAVKVRLPMSDKIPGMPPGAVVGAGSGADVVGERSAPMTGATMLVVEHMAADLTMIATLPKESGGAEVTTKGRLVGDKKTVAGGEIPAPAKPEAPAPGAK